MSKIIEKIKKLSVDDIIEFRDHGDIDNAPEEIVHYLKEMEKVRGMHVRFDHYGSRDAIINHLIKFDGYTQYLASKLYDDTMEYFYCDRGISKKAWRNIIAEQMHKGINTAFKLAKDGPEVLKAVKELLNMAKVLRLDENDAEAFPKELIQKPIKLYTSSAEALGMPEYNRYELGRFIDELPDLTDGQRQAAKRDAQLLPVKIFKE